MSGSMNIMLMYI